MRAVLCARIRLMTLALFITSLSVVVSTVLLLVHERKQNIRYAPGLRRSLDTIAVRIVDALQHGWATSTRYLERNVLLKGLHMVTYVALVQVRFTERKLVQLSHRIRLFHKDHRVLRRSTHKLAQWASTHEHDSTTPVDRA